MPSIHLLQLVTHQRFYCKLGNAHCKSHVEVADVRQSTSLRASTLNSILRVCVWLEAILQGCVHELST